MSPAASKLYGDGEYIVRQGDVGDCMYLIERGTVEVVSRSEGRELCLAILGPSDFFGEMALIDGAPRSADVRALDEAEAIPLNLDGFLDRMQKVPTLAYQIVRSMEERIGELGIRLHEIGALLPNELEAINACGNAYPLQVEEQPFLQSTREDPSVALRTLQETARHIREMNARLLNVALVNPGELG